MRNFTDLFKTKFDEASQLFLSKYHTNILSENDIDQMTGKTDANPENEAPTITWVEWYESQALPKNEGKNLEAGGYGAKWQITDDNPNAVTSLADAKARCASIPECNGFARTTE